MINKIKTQEKKKSIFFIFLNIKSFIPDTAYFVIIGTAIVNIFTYLHIILT